MGRFILQFPALVFFFLLKKLFKEIKPCEQGMIRTFLMRLYFPHENLKQLKLHLMRENISYRKAWKTSLNVLSDGLLTVFLK